jgi:Glycosyl hydrolases family 43
MLDTLISGTKVLDSTGALLTSGQWCFGATQLAVTKGAFSGSVAPGTETVTIVDGTGTTILTIPGVSIAGANTITGAAFNWDTYVLPSNSKSSGVGSPRAACTPGALYSPTGGGKEFECVAINGSGVWRQALLAVAFLLAFCSSMLAQSTLVVATKVIDNTGNPLASGNWCFGATCFAVANGSIPSGSSVTSGTATVTVTNGATTYLTVPSVTIAGNYFSWDTFVVASNASITGIGVPRIACTPGALYTQTDGYLDRWQCVDINGVATWSGLPAPPPAAMIQVGTVTTESAGSPVTVTNSGTSTDAVLNFGIPEGNLGPAGPAGPAAVLVAPWSSMTTYSAGQQVSYGGSIYVSLANSNTGNTPPGAAWVLASSAGLPTSSIQGAPVSSTPPTQGQQLVYSGTAYTPTTVTAPLSSFVPYVSPATPLYVLAHMRDDSQNLHIGYSMDGVLFADVRGGYSAPGYLRDPSMLYVNGVFYFVTSTSQQTISGCAAAPFDSNQIQYFTSIDLVNFTAITQVPLGISGICSAWAPRFFTDPVSGNYYVTVFVGPVNAPNALYIAQFTPSTGTFGSFTQIPLSGESVSPTALFDARVFYDANNATYYLLYCYEAAGGAQYIHLASSPTLKGGFTVVNPSSNDPFGFGGNVENPDVTTLPSGNVLVYADSYTTAINGGRTYQREFVNTSGNFSTIGAVQDTQGVQQEAGTIVTMTNPASAAIVYSAVTHQASGTQASPVGIDNWGIYPYKLVLGSLGTNALNQNPTTGLGWGQSDGSIFGLWGCNAASCMPRVAGTGKLVAYGQPGPWSWLQMITATDTESSYAVAANCTPGTGLASCANNQSAWAFGTNTAVLGAANHKFFFFNGSLQYVPFWMSPTTGESHATMGLTLGNQTAGGITAMNASTGGIDSPAAGVTECNTGTLGNNNCQYAATDFVSLQAVSFAVTSAAGTGATTPTCVSGYSCTPLRGVVLFTTGTANTTTGDLLKIMWPTPRVYKPSSFYQEEDINTTRLAPQMDDGTSTTTQCVMYTTTAPATSTQYRVFYSCGD